MDLRLKDALNRLQESRVESLQLLPLKLELRETKSNLEQRLIELNTVTSQLSTLLSENKTLIEAMVASKDELINRNDQVTVLTKDNIELAGLLQGRL